jgi:hypothetical protein
MFERLRNGWRLAGESFAVLRADKKLLIFPLLSGLACIVVLLSFLLPLVVSPDLLDKLKRRDIPEGVLLAIAFAFYFINYFVIIFFNSALVACALIRFNGGEPTLGDGFRAAVSRLPQILGWALVSATVGLILRIVEENSEKAGKFIVGLLGMAWSAMTFFVVPVLVVEKLGPVAAFKRSTSLVRKAWGESLTGNFSISLIIFLVALAAGLPLVIGIAVGGPALMIGAAFTLALWVVIALVSAAVRVIITAVLYQFAAQKPLPQQFDAQTLQGAFVRK